MGRSTSSDICENVARLGPVEALYASLNDQVGFGPWKLVTREGGVSVSIKAGRAGRLYADVFRKGELVVYLVNESEYASVGVYFLTVFGPDRAAVEAFVRDVSDEDIEVVDLDTVQQTM